MSSSWFLASLSVVGIALISIGLKVDSQIMNSLGGVFFGAAVSATLASIDSRKILESIRSSIQADFRSEESQLIDFRKKWHLYHATSKDKRIWTHLIVDFTNTSTPGSLFSKAYQLDIDGNKKEYSINAGIRDHRFVMFVKAEDTRESSTIAVFPLMGKRYQQTHHGIWTHENWLGEQCISPTIISAQPIQGIAMEVCDVDEETKIDMLDRRWVDEFGKSIKILPSLMSFIQSGPRSAHCGQPHTSEESQKDDQ